MLRRTNFANVQIRIPIILSSFDMESQLFVKTQYSITHYCMLVCLCGTAGNPKSKLWGTSIFVLIHFNYLGGSLF